MNIQKISSIVASVVRSTPKSLVKKRVAGTFALPLVSVPVVEYSLKGDRDSNLTHYCSQAISDLQNKLMNGKISQSDYNSKVRDIKNYYDNAKDLPADVSSSTIKQGAPSFKGDDSDYNVYDGNNDDDCCDCDSDDDCCASDSDCDSGDLLLSSC